MRSIMHLLVNLVKEGQDADVPAQKLAEVWAPTQWELGLIEDSTIRTQLLKEFKNKQTTHFTLTELLFILMEAAALILIKTPQ